VDFSDPQEACRLINRWVNQATNGLIPTMVCEDQVRDALLVLANAIYFHGKWSVPFEKEATELGPFYLSPGQVIEVPMMEQSAAASYARVQDLQILEKRYGKGEFSMVVLLPERYDGIEAFEANLNPQNLEAWLARLEPTEELLIQLPRFRIESNYQLNHALIELGMADVFTLKVADFSGITGKKDFFVSEVIHKAVIEVEEEGTRAAAVTMTRFFLGLPPTPPTVFLADRPFAFLIRHNPSRTILFLGRVMDPR